MAKVEFHKYIGAEVSALNTAVTEYREVNKNGNAKKLSKDNAQKKLESATYAYINKIATCMQQGVIAADPAGIITGKSTYGKEVDAIAQAWHEQCVANTPEGQVPLSVQLRQTQHIASCAGENTGPWKRITYFLANGVKVIYENGKNAILWVYKNVTMVVSWAWDVIKKVSGWMWKKCIDAKNFCVNLFAGMYQRIKSFFSKKKDQPIVPQTEPIVIG